MYKNWLYVISYWILLFHIITEKLKQKLALYEKVLGNTAFKAQRYEKACEHYSNCILHYRCKEGYNNRAQASM